ncbi:ankyrin repeat-containing domain protein, partial [Hyaloscypha finlandica]
VSGHVNVIKLLLEKGANVDTADEGGQTPLHQASMIRHIDVIKLLLDKGANVNAVNGARQTPLHRASMNS